jgi:hypothetical protein
MDKVQYRNRYGDIFTFSKTEDGDLLWEGNFEFCRYGWPNVYDDAFKTYNEDGGDMSLEEFKDKVHEYNYDNSTWTMDEKYRKLIYSDRNTIDMLDASGGPFISSGYNMGVFDKSLEGMIVEEFKKTDNNNAWKIIIKK